MMKLYLYLISFILWYCTGNCVQPYFPPQIVFSADNGQTILAIDEINQRAYQTSILSPSLRHDIYVMKHFPYAIPDSPQSKYYVQLLIASPMNTGLYATYWLYGGNTFNSFPTHWRLNASAFIIDNYLKFDYEMLHSNSSSEDEDYWYANTTCQVRSGKIYPCQEIYFKKGTDIPLRLVEVAREQWDFIQITINYTIISIGKPDDKYFDSIPKNWSDTCLDTSLALLYHPELIKLTLNQSSQIHISLAAPPHRINGNDTLIIQWSSTDCNDCFIWTPTQLTFNINNFHQEQTLTITRVKDGARKTIVPTFYGGGFDFFQPGAYPIFIE